MLYDKLPVVSQAVKIIINKDTAISGFQKSKQNAITKSQIMLLMLV